VFSGGASFGATAALVKTRKTVLTNVQIKALAAHPIAVVPAVANKMHQFLGGLLKLNAGANVLVEQTAPDDLVFRYVDGLGAIVSTSPDSGALIVSAVDAHAIVQPIAVEGLALAACVGVPIVAHNTGDEWIGNAANDATLEVTVAYVEHDVS
jgi:hypothetical protein